MPNNEMVEPEVWMLQRIQLLKQNLTLVAALNEVRVMVTDVQDGFEIVGTDGEILDIINSALYGKR